jgi:hypothetical protein
MHFMDWMQVGIIFFSFAIRIEIPSFLSQCGRGQTMWTPANCSPIYGGFRYTATSSSMKGIGHYWIMRRRTVWILATFERETPLSNRATFGKQLISKEWVCDIGHPGPHRWISPQVTEWALGFGILRCVSPIWFLICGNTMFCGFSSYGFSSASKSAGTA